MPGKKVEGWFKDLDDGRIEVFLKAANIPGVEDCKVRASGKEEAVHEIVTWFEDWTNLAVNIPRRVRRGPKQMAGQMSLEATPELSLDDTVVPDA